MSGDCFTILARFDHQLVQRPNFNPSLKCSYVQC